MRGTRPERRRAPSSRGASSVRVGDVHRRHVSPIVPGARGNDAGGCRAACLSGAVLPALLTGLGLGALVAAQVGPVSLLCIRTTLRYGAGPGLAVGAGAAAVDTVYGALGMLGAGALVTVAPVRVAMGAVGAVVLVVMGVRTLSAAQRVRLGLE